MFVVLLYKNYSMPVFPAMGWAPRGSSAGFVLRNPHGARARGQRQPWLCSPLPYKLIFLLCGHTQPHPYDLHLPALSKQGDLPIPTRGALPLKTPEPLAHWGSANGHLGPVPPLQCRPFVALLCSPGPLTDLGLLSGRSMRLSPGGRRAGLPHPCLFTVGGFPGFHKRLW